MNPNLTLQNEDSLCNTIIELANKNPDYLPLLEYVHFEYLSADVVEKVLDVLEREVNL
jgi:hypothetical protein